MEGSMSSRPYHSSSTLFSQGLTTKPSLAASAACGPIIATTSCCPGVTTTALCCSNTRIYSTPITTYPETQSDSPPCSDCDPSSTPPHPPSICVTRIYPSPPLTGSALKKSVPLPEVNGESVMGSVSDAHPRNVGSGSRDMSHDGPASVAALDLDPHPVIEPLSPPPTLAVVTRELPPVDPQSSSQASRIPGPRLPSPTDDEASLPPFKRPRRERPEIFTDSLPECSPSSSQSSWGYRSAVSAGSSTAYSPYSRDAGSSSWASDSTEMECSPSSSSFHGLSPPSSPKPKTSSLDPTPLSEFSPTYSDVYHTDAFSQPSSSRSGQYSSGLLWFEPSHYDADMAVDPPAFPPPSPRASSLHIPFSAEPEAELSFADTIMPAEDEGDYLPPGAPPPSSSRLFQSEPPYTSHQDMLYLTPAPRSPHAALSALPDLDMDDPFEPPSSPHSPHSDLPGLPEDELYPPHPADTISPSLLSPVSDTLNEGLGLFLQSDPPLRRSPSPDDDALQFLDVQFDPATSSLDVDEFLALRSLRKRALDAEREARMREISLNERVSNAASALLPSSLADAGVLNDHMEKRARKHELHVAMDLRAEARKDRKREKQKTKEIGALLDFKMSGGYSASLGLDTLGSVRQLVASMMMRRRDATRSLANRKSASAERPYSSSSLSFSTSYEDLSEADRETE